MPSSAPAHSLLLATLVILFVVSHVHQLRDTTLIWRDYRSMSVIFVVNDRPSIGPTENVQKNPPHESSQWKNTTSSRLLVIAAVPKDARHISTLWTELECFTPNIDKVILSAPHDKREIIEKILVAARTFVPHFSNGAVQLEAQYYVNDRYDVGLWCDALHNVSEEYDEVGLLNDSVFALRPNSQVFDALQSNYLELTSMAYSYSAKYFRAYGPEYFWVESVYRAMNRAGLQTFQKHSCVPPNHPFFCANDASDARRKACIVNNFEHDLAMQYGRNESSNISTAVKGIYLADAPLELITQHSGKTWATNDEYWKKLVAEQGFPMVKAKRTNIIPDFIDNATQLLSNPLLRNCTRYITTADLEQLISQISTGMSNSSRE